MEEKNRRNYNIFLKNNKLKTFCYQQFFTHQKKKLKILISLCFHSAGALKIDHMVVHWWKLCNSIAISHFNLKFLSLKIIRPYTFSFENRKKKIFKKNSFFFLFIFAFTGFFLTICRRYLNIAALQICIK